MWYNVFKGIKPLCKVYFLVILPCTNNKNLHMLVVKSKLDKTVFFITPKVHEFIFILDEYIFNKKTTQSCVENYTYFCIVKNNR